MKNIMTGTLTVRMFEEFTLPIKVFSAIEDTTPKSHYLHNKCGTQINLIPRCPKCEEVISHSDIVEGYVVSDSNELALLSEEEVSSLNALPKAIGILEFAPLSEYDLIRPTGTVYYLGVDGTDSTTYRLFYRAMLNQQAFGIAYWSFRGRERLCTVRPDPRGVLVLQPIYHNSEIRSAAGVPFPTQGGLNKDHIQTLARMIEVKTTQNVNWGKYEDLYAKKLSELLASRTKFGKLNERLQKANIVDLLENVKLNGTARVTKLEKKPVKKARRKAS